MSRWNTFELVLNAALVFLAIAGLAIIGLDGPVWLERGVLGAAFVVAAPTVFLNLRRLLRRSGR